MGGRNQGLKEDSGKKRPDTNRDACGKYCFLLVGTRLQPTVACPSLPHSSDKERVNRMERRGRSQA